MKVAETIRQTILFAVTRPLLHMALSTDEKKKIQINLLPHFLIPSSSIPRLGCG